MDESIIIDENQTPISPIKVVIEEPQTNIDKAKAPNAVDPTIDQIETPYFFPPPSKNISFI